MGVRKRCLPAPWYPTTAEASLCEIKRMAGKIERGRAVACVAPHAGWYFSGTVAARAIAELDPYAQSVIVFGGHLGPTSRIHMATEDSFITELGSIEADHELRSFVSGEFCYRSDDYPDNTVEIQLPLVKFFFPTARLLWLRMPAHHDSWECGRRLALEARRLNRRTVVIGSTDLTHYGDDYGFSPQGIGTDAERWVEDVNDKRFIDALLANSPEKTLERALSENSACSPGAAIAAMGFATEYGIRDARLLSYTTSAHTVHRDSFVGYAAIAWTSESDPIRSNNTP